jgi:hypothetical protein
MLMMFAPFEQTEQTVLGAGWPGWGTDILTTSRQKIPHQHVIATSHYPKANDVGLLCQSPAAELCSYSYQRIGRDGEPTKPKSRRKSQQANCKARDIGTSMARPNSLRVENAE